MTDKNSITHFFSTMPVASFFSDFLDKKNISIKLPSEKEFEKYEKEPYVESMNKTFGIETSFSDRLGLYTLFLNTGKFKKMIEIILSLTGNESDIEYNDIVIALNQLKTSSESIKLVGGNPAQILKFIIMLSVLIGNIFMFKFMMNSFSYKYENSVAYKTMSTLVGDKCKAPKSINPLIDYTFQSLANTNLLSANEKSTINGLMKAYNCFENPEYRKEFLQTIPYDDEPIQLESLKHIESNQLTLPTPPSNQLTLPIPPSNQLTLPTPPSNQLALSLPPSQGFDDWNKANQVQEFPRKILDAFEERRKTSKLTTLEFIDAVIDGTLKQYDRSVTEPNPTIKQNTSFNDVASYIGNYAYDMIKSNFNELKEGRVNPTFVNDIWPEIKHLARLKKAYYMYKINILEATVEKAGDEIYSLFMHAALMFAFTNGVVLVQSAFLYKYVKAVFRKDMKLLTNGSQSKQNLHVKNDESMKTKSKSKRPLIKAGSKSKKNVTKKIK